MMRRCFFHVGQFMPCHLCARLRQAQRAEDMTIVARRHRTRARRASTGSKYGKRGSGLCFRGHVKTGRKCHECHCVVTGADIRKPVACSVCGVEFVRRFNGQKRCASHMRTQQRRRAA